MTSLDLDQRCGWPQELRVLLERFPRAVWREQRSAGAQFWLDVHGGFRRQTAGIIALIDEYRAADRTPQQLAVTVTARLHGLIAHLHGHHQIEDLHYFPAFRSADARLASGIDALSADHRLLDTTVIEALTASDALGEALAADRAGSTGDAVLHAADKLAAAADLLAARLLKHLDDEEDLVIPLMLDR